MGVAPKIFSQFLEGWCWDQEMYMHVQHPDHQGATQTLSLRSKRCGIVSIHFQAVVLVVADAMLLPVRPCKARSQYPDYRGTTQQ